MSNNTEFPTTTTSTSNPVVEDCALDMKWSEVIHIIQFMKNDAVSIVDFERTHLC